jgi:hypothetical protein
MSGHVVHPEYRPVKRPRKGAIPWGTHAVGSLAFVAWIVGGTASAYGIDWTDTEWWPWRDTDRSLFGLVAFLCLVLAPAVALIEAGLARLGSAWPARIVALAYVFHIGLLSAFPFAFRLPGVESPGDGTSAVLFVQAFLLLVAAQLGAAVGAARILASPAVRVVGRDTRGEPAGTLLDRLRGAHERFYGPRARHDLPRPGPDETPAE